MKEFEVGMVLGKFYPPHNGHLYLIDTAESKCDIVYVLCCSLKSEKIPGLLRWAWLTKIYGNKPNVRVIHVDDENPQHPEEGKKKEFYDIWYKTVYKNVPTQLDAVFTSEDYGDEFAESLKCKHVLVDKERVNIPISGTKVREDAFKHWDKIPDTVKGYFTKKVVVVGPESTGKSTLVKNLHNFFGGSIVPEYGRTYTEDMSDLTQMNQTDFDRIGLGHCIEIGDKNMFPPPHRFKFIDTEAITTKIFGKLYLGDEFESLMLEIIIRDQNFDLWFLMDTDVPYVQDGNRLPESNRQRHFNMLKDELDKRNIKYVLLSGNFENRYENAKNEVYKLLN